MSKANKFGGSWTELKISILETYAKQFLTKINSVKSFYILMDLQARETSKSKFQVIGQNILSKELQ